VYTWEVICNDSIGWAGCYTDGYATGWGRVRIYGAANQGRGESASRPMRGTGNPPPGQWEWRRKSGLERAFWRVDRIGCGGSQSIRYVNTNRLIPLRFLIRRTGAEIGGRSREKLEKVRKIGFY